MCLCNVRYTYNLYLYVNLLLDGITNNSTEYFSHSLVIMCVLCMDTVIVGVAIAIDFVVVVVVVVYSQRAVT